MVAPNDDTTADPDPALAAMWAWVAAMWNGSRLRAFLGALAGDITLGFAVFRNPLDALRAIARDGLPLPNLVGFLGSSGAVDRAQTFGQMLLLVVGAVVVGVTIITLLMMELIAGEFADAISVDNSFSGAANNTTDAGITAFNVMGQATLVIPVVVVVVLLIGGLIGALAVGGVAGGNGSQLTRR